MRISTSRVDDLRGSVTVLLAARLADRITFPVQRLRGPQALIAGREGRTKLFHDVIDQPLRNVHGSRGLHARSANEEHELRISLLRF